MIPPEAAEPNNVGLWGTLGTGLGLALAAAINFLANRNKKPAEQAAMSAQEAASSAEAAASKAAEFANDSIQRALARLDGEIASLRQTTILQAEKIEQMRMKEQLMALNILRLEAHVDRLQEIMRSNNIVPPERPVTGEMRSV